MAEDLTTWRDRATYITALQALSREVGREMDKAQVGEPLGVDLIHAFEKVQKARKLVVSP